MLGNHEDRMAGKSKVCMGIQSQLILPNWIYSSLSLCKLKLMNLKKLYTKCGEHSSPLSLFRKFDFFHTLCVMFVLSDYRKCMEELMFTKSNKGLLCTPDVVCSFFKFISYKKLTEKPMDQARRVVHQKIRPFHFQVKTYYLSVTRIIQRIIRL